MSDKLHRLRKALLVTACVAAAGAALVGALVLPGGGLPGGGLQGWRLDGLAARLPDALARPQSRPQTQVAEAPGSASQPAAPQADGAPPAAAPDPMIFGMLPATFAPPAARLAPASATPGIASLPLSATSLSANSLQSIGDTFSGSAAVALPELGGAAALDGPADAGLDEPVAQAELANPQVPPPTGKIIVLDASEGTKLDPLRQRNWDLNSAHVVPQIKPQP